MEFNYSIGFKVKKKTIKKFIIKMVKNILTLQFSSVAQSCPTLCDPMSRSMPGLPVHHQLPEFTQSIELVMPSSHLILSFPSPPAPNPSQHQGLFQ